MRFLETIWGRGETGMWGKDSKEKEHHKKEQEDSKKLKLSANDLDEEKNENTEVVDPQPRINTENL